MSNNTKQDINNKTTYNQKELLELGLTKGLIKKFLPEPNLVTNPFYRSGPKIKHWNKTLVDTVMQSAEFNTALAKLKSKREKARHNAQNTILKEYNECINDIEKVLKNITITKMDYYKLKKLTLEYNEQRILSQGLTFYYPNDDTLNKWMVNYIRHELTSYDNILETHIFKRHEKYFRTELKLGILHEINKVYPELEHEVTNQIFNLIPIK